MKKFNMKNLFIKSVRCEVFTGGGKKINALFYDWDNGYKYMVYCNNKTVNKKELMNVLYEWVINEVQPPYNVLYKYAETDNKRFKVSLKL